MQKFPVEIIGIIVDYANSVNTLSWIKNSKLYRRIIDHSYLSRNPYGKKFINIHIAYYKDLWNREGIKALNWHIDEAVEIGMRHVKTPIDLVTYCDNPYDKLVSKLLPVVIEHINDYSRYIDVRNKLSSNTNDKVMIFLKNNPTLINFDILCDNKNPKAVNLIRELNPMICDEFNRPIRRVTDETCSNGYMVEVTRMYHSRHKELRDIAYSYTIHSREQIRRFANATNDLFKLQNKPEELNEYVNKIHEFDLQNIVVSPKIFTDDRENLLDLLKKL